MALTCTSLSTGNWNVVARWSCGRVPIAADTAVIANTRTVTVTANAAPVGAVTVNAGGTLNVGGFNFTVNSATAVSGTLAHVTSTAGTKTYIGLVTVNAGGVWNNAINAAVTFRGGITHNGATFTGGTGTQTFNTNNQAIGGASPVNFGGAVAVAGNIRITNNNTNVVTVAGNLTGSTAGSTWVNGANSTLNYRGAAAPMGTRVFTASAAGNTVNYSGAAQTVRLPSASTYYHLTLSGSNTKTPAAGAYTIAGNFSLTAGVTCAGTTNNPTVNLAGNFTNNGTFNSGTGTFTFNGTAAQTLNGVATTFTNMRMNNAAGLTINNNVTVTTATAGTLTLNNGVITTGASTVITNRPCNAPAVSRTSGHIAGNLQKRIPIGVPVSCTFETGDATTYRPINTTFASVTTAGNVTGWSSQSAGDHPDTTNLLSGIDPLLSVNRYWTLTNSGTVFTTCSATFNYVAGDLDGSTTPASFIIGRGSSCSGNGATRTCTSWAQITPVPAATGTQATATGLTAFGDFAVGQARNPNFSREPQFIYTRELY